LPGQWSWSRFSTLALGFEEGDATIARKTLNGSDGAMVRQCAANALNEKFFARKRQIPKPAGISN